MKTASILSGIIALSFSVIFITAWMNGKITVSSDLYLIASNFFLVTAVVLAAVHRRLGGS